MSHNLIIIFIPQYFDCHFFKKLKALETLGQNDSMTTVRDNKKIKAILDGFPTLISKKPTRI